MKVFQEGASVSVKKRYKTKIKGKKIEQKVRKRYETKIKGKKIEQKGRNSNKKYETLMEGKQTRKEGATFKRNYTKYETKHFSQFCETTRNTFFRIFVFFSVSRNFRMAGFVSRKTKKNMKLSTPILMHCRIIVIK